MFKYLLFTLLYFPLQNHSYGQVKDSSLELSTKSYLKATQSKDWKTVLEMMNPKIFNFAPKAMLEQMYRQMENDAGMKFVFSEIEIMGIKSEYSLADTSYIPVDYSMTILVHINPNLYKNPEDVKVIHQGFEKTYAGQEVIYDPINSRFSIDIKNTLIASSAQNSNRWYFSEYKANDPILNFILPEEVMNRLLVGWN